MTLEKPVVYIIMDGWGIAPPGKGNAISRARTPNFDRLWRNYPHARLGAGGESIGLCKGHQGSSEIGHFIIGAGRNVLLPQGIVENAIRTKKIFKNKVFLDAIKCAKRNKSTLHLAGLISDKGVHNYDIAVHALIEMAARNNVKDVVVHFFSDGRDTGPYDAKKYLSRLEKVLKKNKAGRIGTVIGRYWIMDRDNRWNRVEKGYNAMVYGKAEYYAKSAREAIENSYNRGYADKKKGKSFIESDEFIKPTVIVDENNDPVGRIKDKDAMIWVNFRTDRAIEPVNVFIEKNFKEFKREKRLNIHFACAFQYYKGMPAPFAFKRIYPEKTFGEIISDEGLKQFRVTETEKWIYVTTIFSGMREKPFRGEDRLLIPSDKIPTYDLKPRMHTKDIAREAVKALNSDKYEFIMLNFNNPDIIGHTGNMKAVIEGVEECDKGVGMVVDATLKKNGLAVISADHGNAEEMYTRGGYPHTNHTSNDVPFIIVDDDFKMENVKLKNGALKDITPTILDILNLKKPKEMTGKSLILK